MDPNIRTAGGIRYVLYPALLGRSTPSVGSIQKLRAAAGRKTRR
jgi:hypothetical protein